jgi:2-polyprenyl-3-methyl-5-hydroxy-6-metoxy-1,4-benzoquinol methylase
MMNVKKLLSKIRNRFNRFYYKNKKFKTEDEFYTYLFTKDPSWNSPDPNEDESIRWGEISTVIDSLPALRGREILEIGCGRGWLSKKLSAYGKVTGIEPVSPVIKYAQKMFPEIEFHADLPDSFMKKFPAKQFDLIVSSEVLEHVTDKPEFMKQVQSMLKPNGVVIITTPRLEHYDDFISVYGSEPGQPVEEWMSEPQVEELVLSGGFEIIKHKVFAPLPIKERTVFTTQLWAFKRK